MRKVKFLGHDEEGRAVFQDCEYPSDAPQTVDLTTHKPAWSSPNAFRLQPETAREHYGNDYVKLGRAKRDATMEAAQERSAVPLLRDILKRERDEEAKRARDPRR
jgi:hypothetical protein